MNIRQKREPRIDNATDACTRLGYDNLDRLTIAEYGIDDTNEVYTVKDARNRDVVNVGDGNYIDEALSGAGGDL